MTSGERWISRSSVASVGFAVARYAAFLRGINVGGRTAKKDQLVSALDGLGLEDVSTFRASGNVLFDAGSRRPKAADIEATLGKALGYAVPVYLRSAAQLAEGRGVRALLLQAARRFEGKAPGRVPAEEAVRRGAPGGAGAGDEGRPAGDRGRRALLAPEGRDDGLRPRPEGAGEAPRPLDHADDGHGRADGGAIDELNPSPLASCASPGCATGKARPVEPVGFEPTTSCLQSRRSSQLSYGPGWLLYGAASGVCGLLRGALASGAHHIMTSVPIGAQCRQSRPLRRPHCMEAARPTVPDALSWLMLIAVLMVLVVLSTASLAAVGRSSKPGSSLLPPELSLRRFY